MISFSKDRNHKAFIAVAIAVELVIIVVYGLFGNMLMNDSNIWKGMHTTSTKFYYYFLMNLNNIYFGLVLLVGFALVMVYLKHSSWSAIGFSLIITSICVQLYPLVSTFWNNVFVTGFNGNVVIDPTFSMNGCVRVAVSMLVVLAALIGRIGLLDNLLIGITGVVIYSLNIAVNISIAKTRSAQASINDVGGAVDIFLFGGILGAVIGKILKNTNTLLHPRCTVGPGNQNPIIALIGTMFIWCGFIYLSINDPINQKYMNLGVMNTFLCMASCVVTIVGLAAIIHLRIGILEIIFGSISGGVIIGSCSMIIVNPAISILLGIIAGTVTYWYLHMAHKWMNMEGIIDSTGVIGVYIINGIISPIFSCILIAFYTSHPTGKPLFLGVTVGVDGGMSNATFQLIHLGVTAGIAILTGIFLGWILRCIGSKQQMYQLFDDFTDFGTNYQLTTMPVMIIPPPTVLKPIFRNQQSSSNRLFEPNVIPPSRSNTIVYPIPSQIAPPITFQRPVTPPPIIQQNVMQPMRPVSPIQNLNANPVQIRSIIYQDTSSRVHQNKGITTIPSPYRPLSPVSNNIPNIFQLPQSNHPSNIQRKY